MTCKWEELTNVVCTKPAARWLRDFEKQVDIPLCQEHYDEFMKDKKQSMSEHVCHCEHCAPIALDPSPLREGHIALRWSVVMTLNDQPYRDDEGRAYSARFSKIIFDGVDVSNDTIEACPGENGFIIRYVDLPEFRTAMGSGKHICVRCRQKAQEWQEAKLLELAITDEQFFSNEHYNAPDRPTYGVCWEKVYGKVAVTVGGHTWE